LGVLSQGEKIVSPHFTSIENLARMARKMNRSNTEAGLAGWY
jgi:hypothetical protein